MSVNKILIGSTAIKHWFPDFNREPKDLDYIVNEEFEKENSEKRVEYLPNPVFKDYEHEIMLPDDLYTLKISHSFWDLENKSWEKHMWDIQFLKEKGCKLDWNLFWELYEYWNELHGENKRSNLKMSAEDFFDNAIKYSIPHDDLHEILIQHPYFEGQIEPTYKKILIGEVDVCMEKFKELTEKEKFNLVFEEVAVMAIERFPKKMYYKQQYQKMLKKFIISHAKIEEALWIIENHKNLLCNIPFNFKEFINQNILETV